MSKNINEGIFDDSTLLKLEIFKDCFKEWLPVYIYNKHISSIYIFDFFAGSGSDSSGNYGSPLILLDVAKGNNRDYCSINKKPTYFVFNEIKKSKKRILEQNVDLFINNCLENYNCDRCIFEINFFSDEFKSLFYKNEIQSILQNPKIGKFVILDQYGFREIDTEIFRKLISFPNTDFIFFISSTFVKRFKELEVVRKYIDTQKIPYDESKPTECHRVIAEYYKSLIPANYDYYIHHFTIKKKSGNYHGLIFGSNHSYGMEKFLKVCWNEDPYSGESNFNINNDWPENSLFYNPEITVKKNKIAKKIKENILNGNIDNNIDGMKFSMHEGCKPELFTSCLKELKNSGKIEIIGNENHQSTKIHEAPGFSIKVKENV
jgi:three-Cys-motif partner protein